MRKRRGLSVTAAASKMGISACYLSAIERGSRPTVAPATYIRICDAMGVEERDELLRDVA
jgi:transcriptional regulator with XRE-family HTH domain